MRAVLDPSEEITKPDIDISKFRSMAMDEPAAIGKLTSALTIVEELDREVSGMKLKFRAAVALIKDAIGVMEKPDAG